ncbi:MAG: hypothetical protein H6937_06040 [Burkholderiales bacterium]|nr:hypothetical protein [Burkholderiales bacterium]MDR4517431.1 hypothetical protein [Nitrosomonas sp.]
MNRQEFEATLRKMSSEEFDAFVKDFGGDAKIPDTIIRNYIDHPEWEPRLCQILGFLTEEERRTEAILRSATSARWSAIAAAISAIIALLALLFALGFGKGNNRGVLQIVPADQEKPTASQPVSPGS